MTKSTHGGQRTICVSRVFASVCVSGMEFRYQMRKMLLTDDALPGLKMHACRLSALSIHLVLAILWFSVPPCFVFVSVVVLCCVLAVG